jgi:flagellar basal-body rod protein FlgC
MDFFSAAEIVSSGLGAERTLMNTTSSNLANAQTTRTAEGGPYKRIDPVFETQATSFQSALGEASGAQPQGVQVSTIKKDDQPPRLVYDPGHPDANAQGYVAMPNVNMVEEMVNMVTASRAYEAGVHAMSTLSNMAQRALGIGK